MEQINILQKKKIILLYKYFLKNNATELFLNQCFYTNSQLDLQYNKFERSIYRLKHFS